MQTISWQEDLKQRRIIFFSGFKLNQEATEVLCNKYSDDTIKGLTKCITDWLGFSNHRYKIVNMDHNKSHIRTLVYDKQWTIIINSKDSLLCLNHLREMQTCQEAGEIYSIFKHMELFVDMYYKLANNSNKTVKAV